MEIQVKRLLGVPLAVKIGREATVKSLMGILAADKEFGIPEEEQLLLFIGKIISDSPQLRLSECGIREDDTVTVVRKQRSGRGAEGIQSS